MLVLQSMLGALIFSTPVFLIVDGPVARCIVTGVAALSLLIVVLRGRPDEAGFLLTVIRPAAAAAIAPGVWMLVQLLPLQSFGLANPIWQSTAAALGRPLPGFISIDPGATIISFGLYITFASIAFVAAAVTIERGRAEWILFALTSATTLISLIAMAPSLVDFPFLSADGSGSRANIVIDIAGLGVILAAAAALHTVTRRDSRPPYRAALAVRFWPTTLVCIAALAICSLSFIVNASGEAYFAVAFGFATLVATVVIRRFNLGLWGYSAISSIALVVLIAAVTLGSAGSTTSLTLAFTNHASVPMIPATQRILTDVGWAGTGAGTFAAILSVYRDVNEMAIGSIAPTTAAAVAIEMGRPFLVALLAAAIAFVVMLLHSAVRRHRDSIYSTAGASCVVVITLLAFDNAALFSTPVLVIAAVVGGLAIGQSKSRLI